MRTHPRFPPTVCPVIVLARLMPSLVTRVRREWRCSLRVLAPRDAPPTLSSQRFLLRPWTVPHLVEVIVQSEKMLGSRESEARRIVRRIAATRGMHAQATKGASIAHLDMQLAELARLSSAST